MTEPRSVAGLREEFKAGRLDPAALVGQLGRRADEMEDYAAWTRRLDIDELAPYVERLAGLRFGESPLWGLPFAIKDNIDLSGVPTTAGCPDFAYTPERSAFVVERLVAAGAIPVGKTNMDQFATGLVGTRSPYGPTRNALRSDYISGGSSSGSAVAVKLGLVPFALGTDTAGSGRVPAAFNDLVGFKPSRGWWSTRGLVPACRTLDCVSVFTRSVADAVTVADVVGGFDPEDPFARHLDFSDFDSRETRYGFWDPAALPSMDEGYLALYEAFVARLPGAPTPIDPSPFLEAGGMLYDGPWLAERYAAVGEFLEANPDSLHPVTREVIAAGRELGAADGFRAMYRLAALKRATEGAFRDMDVLVAPTVPTIYRIPEVLREPFHTNARLGTFTNAVNLLDLCAVAIPTEPTPDGLPFGVTLMGLAGSDYALLDAAARLRGESSGHNGCGGSVGIAPAAMG